jgi:ABC-type multidrug transport system fused ATPase/permease subunit
MRTKVFLYGKYVLWGILGVVAIAGFGFIVMWLWNWLVPELFNGPVIGYWQTLGLFILAKILFSGIGHGQAQSHDHRHRQTKEYWKNKFHKKMNGIAEDYKEVTVE